MENPLNIHGLPPPEMKSDDTFRQILLMYMDLFKYKRGMELTIEARFEGESQIKRTVVVSDPIRVTDGG